MNVKGVIFLSRKNMIIEKFGQKRWDSFFKEINEKESFFKHPISLISIIPLDKFLFFEDELLKEFFNNDDEIYWDFGKESAEYSLKKGPYQVYVKNNDVKNFMEKCLPILWKTYYYAGNLEVKMEGNTIHFKINNLKIPHIQFEFVMLGYVKKALSLLGEESINLIRIKGISTGDKEIYYKIVLKR